MSLHDCMQARGLGQHLEPGLKALGSQSKRIKIGKPKTAKHSIDLDKALQRALPDSPRWDYGVALQDGERHSVAWIEVHHAASSEVDVVLRKLDWLLQWLRMQKDPCASMHPSFHWVATDSGVHIDSARRKKLAARGLKMPQSQLKL